MKIAVVVGHNSSAPGAYCPAPINSSEFDYHNKVADEMVRLSKDYFYNLFRGGQKLELIKINREPSSGYSAEIDAAYAKVNASGAEASIELHFNAASPSATGTETLSSGSTKSLALAQHVQAEMLKTLNLRDRGVKVLTAGDRGGRSLHAGRPPAILTEPFFSTNTGDVQAAHNLGVLGSAKMYIRGLAAYAGLEIAEEEDPNAVNPRNVFGDLTLDVNDLTKPEFFSRNHGTLSTAVENINKLQGEQAHGEFFVPLTLVDAFAVMNAEMGMKGSKIDPKFQHSEGEVGLLPLPSNLQFWNGVTAPAEADHSKLTTERNVSEFLLYLSNIKNKAVGREFAWGEFYSALFRHDSSAEDDKAQMHLVAAVVHGWFIDALYQGVPNYGEIAQKAAMAFTDPEPVIAVLQTYGYKNAINNNASIVRNRIANLNEAVAYVGESPSVPMPTPLPAPTDPTPPEEPTAPADPVDPTPPVDHAPEPAPANPGTEPPTDLPPGPLPTDPEPGDSPPEPAPENPSTEPSTPAPVSGDPTTPAPSTPPVTPDPTTPTPSTPPVTPDPTTPTPSTPPVTPDPTTPTPSTPPVTPDPTTPTPSTPPVTPDPATPTPSTPPVTPDPTTPTPATPPVTPEPTTPTPATPEPTTPTGPVTPPAPNPDSPTGPVTPGTDSPTPPADPTQPSTPPTPDTPPEEPRQ